jgi:hypothetical protein
MASNKRTSIQRARDLAEIAELYLRRKSQQYIADELNRRRREEYEQAVKEAQAKREKGEDWPSVIGAPSEADEIPESYTLSRAQVGYDIEFLIKEWLKDAQHDIDRYKAEQLQSINKLEEAAWEGYERSLKVRDVMTRETYDVEVEARVLEELENEITKLQERTGRARIVKLPGQKKHEKRTREQLLGDPRYLLVIDRCLERRERLFGLAVTKIEGSLSVKGEVKLYGGIDVDKV